MAGDVWLMKTSPALFLFTAFLLLLAACSPVRVDPNAGLPTGVLTVKADAGNPVKTSGVIATMDALALQYPRRPAFETAVMQRIRTGELEVDSLAITYADGTSRVFK